MDNSPSLGPGGEHEHDIYCWLTAAARDLRYALDGKLDLESTARSTIKLIDRALLAWPPVDY